MIGRDLLHLDGQHESREAADQVFNVEQVHCFQPCLIVHYQLWHVCGEHYQLLKELFVEKYRFINYGHLIGIAVVKCYYLRSFSCESFVSKIIIPVMTVQIFFHVQLSFTVAFANIGTCLFALEYNNAFVCLMVILELP